MSKAENQDRNLPLDWRQTGRAPGCRQYSGRNCSQRDEVAYYWSLRHLRLALSTPGSTRVPLEFLDVLCEGNILYSPQIF